MKVCMRTSFTIIALLTFSICSWSQGQDILPYQKILGNWHGSSICVDKKTDPACKDEEVIYTVVPIDSIPNAVFFHAFKVIKGTPEPMGDFTLAYSDSVHFWSVEFSGRLRARWSFQINDTLLNGTLREIPSERLIRQVVASRYKSQ